LILTFGLVMKKYVFGFLAFAVMMAAPSLAHAQNDTGSYYQTPAKYLIIMDSQSGEILFEKNARVPMAPASMTKIMTASVVFERLKAGTLAMDDEFTVSEKAWRKGGSSMYLEPKMKVSVRDLLHGVIVQSGNDACITLAEGIAGSEEAFAIMMNEQAHTLGLKSAHFKNSTGWPDPDHVISAYDLAILARHTIETYPEYYKIYAETSFTWNKIKQPNRNPLFLAGFPGADGLKTGHTEVSKYGFVGSAIQDGKRRIIVVNGLESKAERKSESARIMRSAFGEFKVYTLFKQNEHAGTAKVFMGKADTVTLVTHENVRLGIHKTLRPEMSVKIKYQSPVPAPIMKGEHIADLVIYIGETEKKIMPLYAGEDVAKKSLMGRLGASLVRKIRGE